MSASPSKKRKGSSDHYASADDDNANEANRQWEDVKKARNRINSQRTREREKLQMESMELEKTRLFLSNDALRFQNIYFRDAIQQIAEVQRTRRTRPTEGSSAVDSAAAAAAAAHQLPPNSVSSLPVLDVNLTTGALGSLSASRITGGHPEHEAFLASASVDPLRYAELGRHSGSGLPGLSAAAFEDLRVRRHVALEMEAALLQRHRATGMGTLPSVPPTMTQSSTFFANLPTGMLPSLDIMELRARQLRMQELEMSGRGTTSADMMVRYPHGIPAPAASFNLSGDRHEDGKQDSREMDRRTKKPRQ
jgi:hypothetical protein